jgi:putative transposase
VNEYGSLYVEDLAVQSLLQKEDSCPAKNRGIADAAWRQFITLLSVKAEWAARTLVQVNPAYTSKRCSACGHIHKDLKDEEIFVCPVCNHCEHRDKNAAKNIFVLGTQYVRASSEATFRSPRL